LARTWDWGPTPKDKPCPTCSGYSLENPIISPDGRWLAATLWGDHSVIRVWDVASGRLAHSIAAQAAPYRAANHMQFSADSRSLVAGSDDSKSKPWIRAWDLETGRPTRAYMLPETDGIGSAKNYPFTFSPDGRWLALPFLAWDHREKNSSINTAAIVDAASGRLVLSLQADLGSYVVVLRFSPDGKTLYVGSNSRESVGIWDTGSGSHVRDLEGNAGTPQSIQFSPDGRRVVIGNSNGTSGVWDTASGERLAITLHASSGEWVTMTPEGFFTASEKGAELLHVVTGFETIGIDQVYQALYRPDLVREKIAGDPRGLVREAAGRLDLTKVMQSGAAPRVHIVSPASGDSSPTDELTVEVEVAEQGGGIGKVEWRVNGLTLGVEERGLARLDAPATGPPAPLKLRRSLALEPGDNVIELVAYNARNLIASEPARTTVKWDGAQATTPPRLHVLAVGVNDYWDSRLRLSYAVPDAKALAEAMKKAGAPLYQSVEVTTVLDGEVTTNNLDKVFAAVAQNVRPRDVFVFFLAGHGKTVDGKYYFLPQDFRYEGEDSIVKRGVDQDRFQAWFARIAARKSILLYDTCESGSLTGDRVAQRGIERVAALDKMTRAMGRTVLSASTEDAPALEGYRGHGVFTYAVLDALNAADDNGNGLIEVTELASHIDQKVPDLSYEAFKLRQVPQMKIVGSNFPLASRFAALSGVPVQATPAAAAIPTRPTHVVITPTTVRQTAAAAGAAVTELQVGTLVTLVQVDGQWVIIARDGKRVGYVEERVLARVQ
jgi:uncharacterized caspase-like protein